RPRAEIQYNVRLEVEEFQATHQFLIDARLQNRGRLISRTRAIKGSADAGPVEAEHFGTIIPSVHRDDACSFFRARAFMRFFFAGRPCDASLVVCAVPTP